MLGQWMEQHTKAVLCRRPRARTTWPPSPTAVARRALSRPLGTIMDKCRHEQGIALCAAKDMMMAGNLHCIGCGDDRCRARAQGHMSKNLCPPKVWSTVRMLSMCPAHTLAKHLPLVAAPLHALPAALSVMRLHVIVAQLHSSCARAGRHQLWPARVPGGAARTCLCCGAAGRRPCC